MFLSNLLICCWMWAAWPFWVSNSLFRCLKEKHGTGSFSNTSKCYFFKENAHSYRPDPLLDIFGKEVGSGLVSGVTAVSEDLISFHRKGRIAVLRRISALHHSPSLCTILNKQENKSHHDLAPPWLERYASSKMWFSRELTLMSRMHSIALWSIRQLATTGSSISSAWSTEG